MGCRKVAMDQGLCRSTRTGRTPRTELAWQLGGRRAFDKVRQDDERATSPGDTLRTLMNDYGPCLILIDEWVAYARQLHDEGDLPGPVVIPEPGPQ